MGILGAVVFLPSFPPFIFGCGWGAGGSPPEFFVNAELGGNRQHGRPDSESTVSTGAPTRSPFPPRGLSPTAQRPRLLATDSVDPSSSGRDHTLASGLRSEYSNPPRSGPRRTVRQLFGQRRTRNIGHHRPACPKNRRASFVSRRVSPVHGSWEYVVGIGRLFVGPTSKSSLSAIRGAATVCGRNSIQTTLGLSGRRVLPTGRCGLGSGETGGSGGFRIAPSGIGENRGRPTGIGSDRWNPGVGSGAGTAWHGTFAIGSCVNGRWGRGWALGTFVWWRRGPLRWDVGL